MLKFLPYVQFDWRILFVALLCATAYGFRMLAHAHATILLPSVVIQS